MQRTVSSPVSLCAICLMTSIRAVRAMSRARAEKMSGWDPMLCRTEKPSTSSRAIHNPPDFVGKLVEHLDHLAPFVGVGRAGAGLAERFGDVDRFRYHRGQRPESRFCE